MIKRWSKRKQHLIASCGICSHLASETWAPVMWIFILLQRKRRAISWKRWEAYSLEIKAKRKRRRCLTNWRRRQYLSLSLSLYTGDGCPCGVALGPARQLPLIPSLHIIVVVVVIINPQYLFPFSSLPVDLLMKWKKKTDWRNTAITLCICTNVIDMKVINYSDDLHTHQFTVQSQVQKINFLTSMTVKTLILPFFPVGQEHLDGTTILMHK